MPDPTERVEPQRRTDLARLELSRLRIEDGVGLDAVYRLACEVTADALSAERVGVWLLADRRRALRCVDLYEASKGVHTAGLTARVEDFPDYFASLERRKTVPADDAAGDPRTAKLMAAYLEPLGVTSLLSAPILLAGEVVGVIGVEHIGPPREWATDERDFAGSVADIVAIKMRAAEMVEARGVIESQARQLAEARRLDALAEMAAGVAHDVRNVMTVVVGMSSLIEMTPGLPPEIVRHAKQIGTAGQRGATLVTELMAFARPGPMSATVVRPSDMLQSQLPQLRAAAGAGHTVSLDVRSATGRVLISAAQLERVVLNLVINARDASPAGSDIAVSVDVVDDKYEDGLAGRFVLIAVRDQGTGIPADVLPNIFDPYFTTKPRGQGTGLGLAVVSQIVAHAGGFVRIQTAADTGTTFQIFLPRVSSLG